MLPYDRLKKHGYGKSPFLFRIIIYNLQFWLIFNLLTKGSFQQMHLLGQTEQPYVQLCSQKAWYSTRSRRLGVQASLNLPMVASCRWSSQIIGNTSETKSLIIHYTTICVVPAQFETQISCENAHDFCRRYNPRFAKTGPEESPSSPNETCGGCEPNGSISALAGTSEAMLHPQKPQPGPGMVITPGNRVLFSAQTYSNSIKLRLNLLALFINMFHLKSSST